MQQFTLDGTAANKFIKQQLRISIPLALVGVGTAFYFGLGGYSNDPSIWSGISLGLIFITISVIRGWRRQQALIRSYTLTIGENRITREQKNTPTISLSFMEIKEISRTPKGSSGPSLGILSACYQQEHSKGYAAPKLAITAPHRALCCDHLVKTYPMIRPRKTSWCFVLAEMAASTRSVCGSGRPTRRQRRFPLPIPISAKRPIATNRERASKVRLMATFFGSLSR